MTLVPLKLTIKGSFISQMRTRETAIRREKLEAKLKVPPELSWWYWQEFGTASRSQAPSGKRPAYRIPRAGVKTTLAFVGRDGSLVITPTVPNAARGIGPHPGIRPAAFIRTQLAVIRSKMSKAVHEAIENGALKDPSKLAEAMRQAMREAKQIIVQSLARKVRGVRVAPTSRTGRTFPKQAGRLKGKQASEVFKKDAYVE